MNTSFGSCGEERSRRRLFTLARIQSFREHQDLGSTYKQTTLIIFAAVNYDLKGVLKAKGTHFRGSCSAP